MKKHRFVPRPLPIGAIFSWDDDEQAIAPEIPPLAQPDTTEFYDDMYKALEEFAPEGATLNAIGFDDINGFLRKGYKVTDNSDALITVARGGEKEFATAKRTAKNKLILCPTHDFAATVTERYLTYDKAFAVVKYGKKPDAVVFDENDIEMPATVFGELASLSTCAFDYTFGKNMRGESIATDVNNEINSIIKDLTAVLKSNEKNTAFVKSAIADAGKKAARIIEKAPELLHSSGASQTYEAMRMLYSNEDREHTPRGDTEMLLSVYMIDFYIKNIGAKKPLFPPDNNKRIDSVCEYLGADLIRSTVYVSPVLSPQKLRLYEYRCREFRQDILQQLFSLRDMLASAFSVFKRLYPDDGFGLKTLIDPADIGICIALAPDVFASDSMLSFFKQTGQLEKLIV